MFEKALKKSSLTENLVLAEAEKLREKGYSPEEIYRVLKGIHFGRIRDEETEIVAEAMEEFEAYLDL